MKRLYIPIIFFLIFQTAFSQGVPGACGLHKGSIVPLNGSGVLGQTFSQSSCGLNYVQASQLTETRSAAAGFNTNGTGLPTNLTISGIPSCPTILKAYVWYTVSYQSGPPATSVVINAATVAATNIGSNGPKCWGEAGSVVYRADVTANVTGNGVYNIDVTGLSNKNWEVDGVTLMIIYKDNGATYQGSLILWDGANTCSGGGCSLTQSINGFSACANSSYANAFLVVADMQTAGISPPQHASTLNGATSNTYSNDFYNFDIINTNVTSGQIGSSFGTSAINGSDCFCWSIMGLYYQTTSCTVCTPSSISLTVTPTPATCAASNGSALAIASGGPTPYVYSWSTGATGTSVSNLAAGSYSVSVTDASGCSAVKTFTISNSTGPTVAPASTSVSCNGGNSGTATVTASGGTPAYTYAWVTTPVQTTSTATGLTAGTYSVLVGDASGCNATYTVAVIQPTALTTTASVINNASCFGSADGSATVNAAGANAPYTYAWTPSGQNSQTASGLAAGNYTVVTTDANGCSKFSFVTITQPAGMTVNNAITNTSCGLNNGGITINVSGGTTPYTYIWSTAAAAASVSNLASGTYSVVVTDASGCSVAKTYSISPSTIPILTPASNPVLCNGGSTGSASVNISGGVPPYSYAWNTAPPQTTPSASNIPAGNYTCVVTDAVGCSQTATYTITEPTALTSTATVVNNVSCFGGSNGSASTSATGGTAPYTYAWSPSGQNTATATGLAAGNFAAVVTDANGCTNTQNVTITQPVALSLPTSSTIASCGTSDGTATVNPSGGAAPYTYLWLTSPSVQVTQTANNLPTGTYSVVVTDSQGCLQIQSVFVPGVAPPVADFNFTPDILSFPDPIGNFTDASSGLFAGWHWNFGDPKSGATNTSGIQNPMHTYSDTGVYCITLIISNTAGTCADTTVKCLKVEAPSTFYIPNAFTPNHDGKNDLFLGYGTYITEFHMYIFDRWGNLIFESNDLNKGWNGSVDNNGDMVQEDVYVWKVFLVDAFDKQYNYVGRVTIVK